MLFSRTGGRMQTHCVLRTFGYNGIEVTRVCRKARNVALYYFVLFTNYF
jgi:hypothetical protein